MEGTHGVDISWLHHSHKDHTHRTIADNRKDSAISTSEQSGDPAPAVPDKKSDESLPSTPTQNGESSSHHNHHLPKPHLPHRQSNESPTSSPSQLKGGKDQKPPPSPLGRRGSWISSLSSKFSSSNQPSPTPGSPATGRTSPGPQDPANTSSPVNVPGAKDAKKADNVPNTPPSPRSPGTSFLQSALRRLSSSSGTGFGKGTGSGVVCPRKVMNVDPYRERCQIEDLQPAKLRRVSFCVDVEIASAVKYPDEEGDDSPPPPPNKKPGPTELEKSAANRKTKEQKVKMKDKAEAEALKHPQGVVDQKDSDDNIKSTEEKMDETPDPVAAETTNNGVNGTNGTNGEVKELTRKKEKKKRSEEERKERKERKRQTAVANGTIPIEIAMESSSSGYSTPGPPTPSTRPHDRPTTDPVRIYRRCCQLRETPILKRVTDQLSAPCAIDSHEDGLVSCLDLSNFEMHLSDMVTLGDYLAVVPVKKLILENCGLTDESLRVVLAGLLAVKTPDQAKYNKDLARRPSDVPKEQTERLGVIEKVSIKNNPNIGRDGWRHIGLFIHMSRSLKAIDLSMVPFPGRLSSPPTFSINLKSQSASKTPADISVTFEKCLAERLAGSRLEEIVMGECSLETEHVEKIVHGVMSCGVTRLGLANNHLSNEALQAVAKYLEASTCEGLDLGGNDLSNNLDIITQAINNDANKLYALSLADCNLSTADLKPLLPALARLPNFRFIDLSHNRKLFSTQPNAISILRKHLPHMNQLKRIHLNDVAMESEHCIALAEILPEIPSLAHLSILENPPLTALASAKDEATQEEACALYASLMAAVRVSDTIVSVEIDVPTAESSEIVQALAKQVVAYSLRNMERGTMSEALSASETVDADANGEEKPVQIPDILLHIVGQLDGYPEISHDEPAPDSDYIVGGTGVVKALSVCLGNKASDYRRPSRDVTPTASGSATPRQSTQVAKSKAMSKNLLGSARKIKARLQPAMAREAKSGDEISYRRLLFLNSTLERIIQRFEDEYPECRLAKEKEAASAQAKQENSSSESESKSQPSASLFKDPFANGEKLDAEVVNDELADDEDEPRPPLSRHGSDVSLALRNLTSEEGQMHRFGQQVRRSMLKEHEKAVNPDDPAVDTISREQIDSLRQKMESLSGAQMREKISELGTEGYLAHLGANAQELKLLKEDDPEGFEKFRVAQKHAQETMGGGKEAHAGHQHNESESTVA